MITIENLHFKYTTDFSLSADKVVFEKEKVYSIIGPNGAGKSTFFKILIQDLKNYEGEVTVAGKPLSHYTIPRLRSVMGYCGSEKILNLKFSVYEFVSLGFFLQTGLFGLLGKAQKERILQLLNDFDLSHLRERNLFELSAGEMKRVRLCKSMVTQPEILIIDEPEEHLDLYHIHRVFEKLTKEYGAGTGRTLIFSTHNINIASKFSDNMLIFKQGEVLYAGATQMGITEDNLSELYNYTGTVIKWPDGKKRFVY